MVEPNEARTRVLVAMERFEDFTVAQSCSILLKERRKKVSARDREKYWIEDLVYEKLKRKLLDTISAHKGPSKIVWVRGEISHLLYEVLAKDGGIWSIFMAASFEYDDSFYFKSKNVSESSTNTERDHLEEEMTRFFGQPFFLVGEFDDIVNEITRQT